MRPSREHSKNCEHATRPKCVCSTCGGSNHGWVGHLERARAGEEGARELRESAENTWWEQQRRFRENGRRTPTKYLRQAGGGVAVAALVSWLAQDTAKIDRVEELGDLLHEEVFDRKLREFAQEQVEKDPAFAEYGRAMAGHFWCDLLVEIANVLDQGAKLQERIPAEVRDAVLEHEDASAWGPVRRSLAEAALGFLWKSFRMVLGTDLESLALAVRVLAVLICPDPGGHPRVARYCLRPLLGESLRDHLKTNVEPEWLWGEGPAPGAS